LQQCNAAVLVPGTFRACIRVYLVFGRGLAGLHGMWC
jgi:hypothetical protein